MINRYRLDRQHQLSQEIQVSGMGLSDSINWTSGLHLFLERGGFWQRVRTYVPSLGTWNENIPGGQAPATAPPRCMRTRIELSTRWKVAAGARYNHEGRQLTSFNSMIQGDSFSCRLSPSLRDAPGLCRATLPERSFSVCALVDERRIPAGC